MAAVVTVPRPTRRTRTVDASTLRPSLQVLDGGRRPGELLTRSPRPVTTITSTPTAFRPLVVTRPSTAVYRRRRLAVAALAVVVVATVWLALVGARAVLAGSPGPAASQVTVATDAEVSPIGPVHVVARGDTLWSIAEGLDADGDVRAIVDELADRSGDGPLQAGQRIPLDGLVP